VKKLSIRLLILTYCAETACVADDSRGFLLYERFLGSANTLGNVFRLDTTLGYSFSKHFSIDGGLPLFVVRPSATAASLAGGTSTTGIGNAYLEGRLTLDNPLLNYSSVLTGTAPTGDKSRGLSTGRATVDWTNHFARPFSRFTPFGNVGFANTVSDTPLFVRPFTTLGFVTHFEGGATCRIARFLEAGAAGYAVEPAGQQTIVSKVVTQASAPTGRAKGNARRGQGVFENTAVTVGPADLARDNGFSFWGGVHASKILLLQVGYTRSVHYSLDTVTFGVSVNLGSVVKDLWSY
jgi:hypothetical protein